MANLPSFVSRRSLYWAAWILLAVSVLLPAPAGSFAGGAWGVSGLYVVGKIAQWSKAAPGSPEALSFAQVVVITLAMFGNIVFAFAPLVRNAVTVSLGCKLFLVAALCAAVLVPFEFPAFVRLPAYWLWVAALATLGTAFLAFPGDGTPRRRLLRKSVPRADEDAALGRVPQLVWVWLGFAVFWLAVTGIRAAHPSSAEGKPDEASGLGAAALSSYVNDNAHVLEPAMVEALNAALARFEAGTSNQVAVATYARVPGGDLESFTISAAERSHLGRKGVDNGAILFVFSDDRKARLEVGYGLEGTLTDVDAHRILEATLVPAFAHGDYGEGLDAALGAIFEVIENAYKQDRMPSRAKLFWNKLKVGAPRLFRAAWPSAGSLELGPRIGIAFFGGLLGLGIWDGVKQRGRLVDDGVRLASNLIARRPALTGMEAVGLDSLIDTLKILGFAIAAIAGATGVVIVAAGGAFGGAGTAVAW